MKRFGPLLIGTLIAGSAVAGPAGYVVPYIKGSEGKREFLLMPTPCMVANHESDMQAATIYEEKKLKAGLACWKPNPGGMPNVTVIDVYGNRYLVDYENMRGYEGR